MSETVDRKIFAQEMNWIVFVFLIILLAAVNFILVLLPIDDDARGILMVTGALINIVFWVDSFYWLKKLPNRRYLTDYYGRLAFVGNLPFLTPLRLVQSVLFYRKLRKLKVGIAQDVRVSRNSQGILLLFLFIAIFVFQTASVLILIFESRDPSANIITSGDALWWSFVTVATVGYGDKYPITAGGRIIALLLMIVGIAMFGIFTSSLSDWFRRPRRRRLDYKESGTSHRGVTFAEMQHLLDQQTENLHKRIDEMEQRLSRQEDN